MEELLEKSAQLVARTNLSFLRYLNDKVQWQKRLIGIKGARGTGKTTLLLQRLKKLNLPPKQASWWSLDDLYFTENSLVKTAETFINQGGKFLMLDEVHKYPNWATHIKNIYDFYPDLKVVFTGSSIIDISRQEADLSRRVHMYQLEGLSYREYLAMEKILMVPPISIHEILSAEPDWRSHFPIEFKPLEHFGNYIKQGYYPFYKDEGDQTLQQVQQMTRLVVEYDMAELEDFDIRNAKKMLQLLYIIANNVPFKPNISNLANKTQIHRNTINNYLQYLEQAQLIRLLYPAGISVALLQKPEKIYLNNSTLAHALSHLEPNKGNIRETFFLSQVSSLFPINYSDNGDFLVDEKYTFEIGGAGKGKKQIANIENSFRVIDSREYPVSDALPLWLFGFLF
jgi:predicted AAA+ superfamily ATPase